MSAHIVTLKLNGKSFRCTGNAGRARCPSKNFHVSVTDEDVPLYSCVVCGTERFGGHSSGIEEQVPMRNDWRTPGGSVMDPKPGKLWTTLHEEYGFTFDGAADQNNTKCNHFFDETVNALTRTWVGSCWWCSTCWREVTDAPLQQMQTRVLADDGVFRTKQENARRVELDLPRLQTDLCSRKAATETSRSDRTCSSSRREEKILEDRPRQGVEARVGAGGQPSQLIAGSQSSVSVESKTLVEMQGVLAAKMRVLPDVSETANRTCDSSNTPAGAGDGAVQHCPCVRCLQLREKYKVGRGLFGSASRNPSCACGLLAERRPHHFWLNPPYCPKGIIEAWLEKAISQAALGVFSVGLIPVATSIGWFNNLVVPFAEWWTFRGRIPFEDPEPDASRTSPKQDNLLVVFDPRSERIGHCGVRDAKTGKKLWVRP